MYSKAFSFPAVIVVLCILQSACSDKDDMIDMPVDASFIGQFVSSAHPTSGSASIDKDGTTLVLSEFKTDSGPDLNIYLATDIGNVESDYIDLGDIKGINGSYAYDLPDNITFTNYRYVVVWCVAFDVNFGYALLEEQ